MSLNNDVRIIGFCAQKPELKRSKNGNPLAILVVYTQDFIHAEKTIQQPHRCVFIGKQAELIAKMADTGRHIHIRGSLRYQRKGEGNDVRYYTNILVEEFRLSPRQSLGMLKDTLREMIAENHITSPDQLGFLQS